MSSSTRDSATSFYRGIISEGGIRKYNMPICSFGTDQFQDIVSLSTPNSVGKVMMQGCLV